jgi:1-acyl-sn-glycerol-3-phosphate acyltransferase
MPNYYRSCEKLVEILRLTLFLVKMKVFLSKLYTIYAGLAFGFTCIFFLLPQLILAQRTAWHYLALQINYAWAWTYIKLLFMPVNIRVPDGFDKKKQYIICTNHFSFLDIPTTNLLGIPFKFIGKSSVAKAPIFGYMFKKIHVMVNRESVRSRANSMIRAHDALSNGFSMCFFPEGGIKTTNPPHMVVFRDGAFRLSTELGYPILPVALHTNYKALPDDGKLRLSWSPINITILDPIYPLSTNEEEEIPRLRQATYDAIKNSLERGFL